MREDLERGITSTAAGMTGRPVLRRVQRTLAQDAADYLDDDETLATPAALAGRGGRGRTLVFAGLGIFLLIGVTLLCLNDRIIEGLALAIILLLVGMNFVRGYAVVLTDRRLLVFRTRGVFVAHLRGLFIAAPRGGVSTVFRRRLGWGVLSVAFAPGTGKAPVEFHFMAAHALIAESIHLVLATRVTNAQAAPGSPAGR